jgi:hypothetical protein
MQSSHPTRLVTRNQARAENKEMQELLLRVKDLIAAIEMLSAERAMLWRRYVEVTKHLQFTESLVAMVLSIKGIAEGHRSSQRGETGSCVWGSSAPSRQKLKSYS